MKNDETTTVRPTKKQRELLNYLEQFITQHGYSPSYREIMNGLGYNSVATVALHINNLIRRGHVRKRDHSARSLELVTPTDPSPIKTNKINPSEEKWLVEKAEYYVARAESGAEVQASELEDLQILVAALRVLGLEGAAQAFTPRLAKLRQNLCT